MPTLWEILTGKNKKKPLELQYCNPLELRIGNSVRIDNVDLSDVPFTLKSLREVKRLINGSEFFFVDYDIASNAYGQAEATERRIRLSPKQDSESTKIDDYDVVLYNKISQCQFDEGFLKSLEGQEEFVEGDATYWRVNDNTAQQDAIIHNVDSDAISLYAKHGQNPPSKKLTYWDFWRETEDEGNKVLEFYNIEMEETTGFFEFWVGRKIDPTRVSIV